MIPLAVAVAASDRNQATPMTSAIRPQAAAPALSPSEKSRAPSPSTTAITIGSKTANKTPHASSRRTGSRMSVLACEFSFSPDRIVHSRSSIPAVPRQLETHAMQQRLSSPAKLEALSASHAGAVKQGHRLCPTSRER
jgi:hypothetical protein